MQVTRSRMAVFGQILYERGWSMKNKNGLYTYTHHRFPDVKIKIPYDEAGVHDIDLENAVRLMCRAEGADPAIVFEKIWREWKQS